MTDENTKEKISILIPGAACKDCAYISNISERQKENISRLLIIEGVLPAKISWSHFKWIMGIFVTLAVVAIASNFTLLTTINSNITRMELTQVVMSKDLEALQTKIEYLHGINQPKK